MLEPGIICILYSVHTGACANVQLLHLYVYSRMSMHFDCQFSRTRDELIPAWDVIWQTRVGDAYFQFWGHPWHPLIRAMMWPYIICKAAAFKHCFVEKINSLLIIQVSGTVNCMGSPVGLVRS